MKTILLISLCGLGFCYLELNGSSVKEKKSPQKIIISPADSTLFSTQVQPILQKNCSPCHFSGGKMYDKLPFDDPETLLNHESGILKRIKKEEEKSILRKFIEQHKVTD